MGAIRFDPTAFPNLRQQQLLKELYTLVMGGLTLRENVEKYIFTHTFGAAPDTEESIDISALGLGFTPNYVWVIEVSNGAVIYPSNKGTWTSSLVKLRSSAANTVAYLGVL